MNLHIRPVNSADQSVLWRMLSYAARVEQDGTTDWSVLSTDPFLAAYALDWGRSGDIGFVAAHAESVMGAAWVRSVATIGHDPIGRYGDAELVIAVEPMQLGLGIGTQLLTALLAQTDAAGIVVYCSVRGDNPAQHLYRRAGFVECDRIVNRVGTESIVMQRKEFV
jgi:ribosomal protein S18 acetylase RimI-like enzyme